MKKHFQAKALILVSFLFLNPQAFAESTNLISFQTSVKNQGDFDHCAFYATTALFESSLKVFFGQDYDVSEKYEVHRSKVLHQQKPEVEFGDTYELLGNFQKDSDFQTEDGRRFSHRGFKSVFMTKLWDSRPWSAIIADQLKKKRSVVITLKVATSAIDDKTGVISYNDEIDQKCGRQELTCGGHAVLLVGYNEEKKVFLFKNSWGPEWGQAGYGFVTADHIDRFSDQPMTGYFDVLVSPTLRELP